MRSNDTVAAYRQRDPRRFPVAAGIVEPLHGARSLQELERIKHELRLEGVVWHNRFQGVALDHELMRPLLRKVSELGLVPLVHTNAESNLEAAWRLERLANEFPELTFIAMDALAGHHGGLALEIAKRTPNIIWDNSGSTTRDSWCGSSRRRDRTSSSSAAPTTRPRRATRGTTPST